MLILITASISGCRDSENEKFRLGGGLYVTKKPTKQEKNIPSPFFPENSRVIESTEIKTPLLDSPESFAFVESDLSMDQLSAFYENAVKLMDWKLLQKSKEEKLLEELRILEELGLTPTTTPSSTTPLPGSLPSARNKKDLSDKTKERLR
ncbi:MAG TPA: hypothetical protein PL048_23740, partial [Leptospiraceae bacterium]|nr:hypothetical protein [Leptospiraceae bacterium]